MVSVLSSVNAVIATNNTTLNSNIESFVSNCIRFSVVDWRQLATLDAGSILSLSLSSNCSQVCVSPSLHIKSLCLLSFLYVISVIFHQLNLRVFPVHHVIPCVFNLHRDTNKTSLSGIPLLPPV